MTTRRLLLLAYAGLALLGLDERLPWPVPPAAAAVLLAVVLLGIGELWLRALLREPAPPTVRLGLTVAAGLVTLPVVALGLHVLAVPIRAGSLAAGLAVAVTLLGAYALIRKHPAPVGTDRGPARTLLAVAVPGVLAGLIGGAAVLAYLRLPHPAQPGYTSVALVGWAAGIDRPVAFPARGLDVPIRVSIVGEPAAVASLLVRVGDRPVGRTRPVILPAGAIRSVEVHVPAPPDGCLHRIEISLGAASTVFYGRGPTGC